MLHAGGPSASEMDGEESARLIELVRTYVEEKGFSSDGLSLYQRIAPQFPGWTFHALRKYYLKTLRMGRESLSSEPPMSSQAKETTHVQAPMPTPAAPENVGKGSGVNGEDIMLDEEGAIKQTVDEPAIELMEDSPTLEPEAMNGLATQSRDMSPTAAAHSGDLPHDHDPSRAHHPPPRSPRPTRASEPGAVKADASSEKTSTMLIDEALESEVNLSAPNEIKASRPLMTPTAELPVPIAPQLASLPDTQQASAPDPLPHSTNPRGKRRRTAKKTSQRVTRRPTGPDPGDLVGRGRKTLDAQPPLPTIIVSPSSKQRQEAGSATTLSNTTTTVTGTTTNSTNDANSTSDANNTNNVSSTSTSTSTLKNLNSHPTTNSHPKTKNRRDYGALETPRINDTIRARSLGCVDLLMRLTGEPRNVILHALLVHSGQIIPAYKYLMRDPEASQGAWGVEDDMALLTRDEQQIKAVLKRGRTAEEISTRFDFLNELCDAPPR